MSAYCVKCKSKREMQEGQKVTMKNGRPAMKGKCPVCGTGLYRILPEVTPEVDPKIMGLPRYFWERGSLRSVNEYP